MPRGRARGYELQRETILARAARAVRAPRLHGDDDEPGRRGLRRLQALALPLRARQAPAARRDRRRPHRAAARARRRGRRRQPRARDAGAGADRPPSSPFYADSQNEHRVLTEDVRFLAPAERRRVLGGERKVVAAFADAIAAARPELRSAGLEKPLAMLLFGMMNWMFTWLQPRGALSHADMAPVVADLFFGGLRPSGRRRRLAPSPSPSPSPASSPHSNGDTACPSSEPPSSPSASPRRPRSRVPTSTSA